MPHGVTYVFFEHSETHTLLGQLRTVSKLGVSNEDWETLWGAELRLPPQSNGET